VPDGISDGIALTNRPKTPVPAMVEVKRAWLEMASKSRARNSKLPGAVSTSLITMEITSLRLRLRARATAI